MGKTGGGRETVTFDRQSVEALMGELAARLASEGVAARIVLVGGAALTFRYDRQATTDVDASLHPAEEVLRHARAMAVEHGLRGDWLNDAAVGFFPHEDPETIEVTKVGQASVERMPSDVILAMKLRACRPRKDLFDIAVLLRDHDVRSVEEAEAWLERFFPEECLPGRGAAVVAAALGPIDVPGDPPLRLPAMPPREAPTVCARWVLRQDGRCVLPVDHDGDCSAGV